MITHGLVIAAHHNIGGPIDDMVVWVSFIKNVLYSVFDISIADREYDGILGVLFEHKISN